MIYCGLLKLLEQEQEIIFHLNRIIYGLSILEGEVIPRVDEIKKARLIKQKTEERLKIIQLQIKLYFESMQG